MNKTMLGSLAGLMTLAAEAHGQCSSWNNLMEITAVVGEEVPLIESELSNHALFVFWPSYLDSCVGFMVDTEGVTVFYTDWEEDENGTFVIDDGNGRLCTVRCDGNGVTVLIEEADQSSFIPAYFVIDTEGMVTAVAPPVSCSCAGTGTRNQIVCTKSACDNGLICKYTGAFPGTGSGWCTWPPPPGGGN